MKHAEELYPDLGSEAAVLIGQINYTQDLLKLINLTIELQQQDAIVHQVDPWPIDFAKFVRQHYDNKGNSFDDFQSK